MSGRVAITGLGEATAGEQDSLETLIYRSARAALAEAGLDRRDLDGVVLAASDQTDGRAISSMLTAGPAGAYLNDEINIASSPGHGLAMGCMQILSGVHERLLVSSWGKGSETVGSIQAAERLSADPFFERDGGLSSLAASAMQAQRHRAAAADPEQATVAAAHVAAKNHGDVGADAVVASAVIASPLRELECPPLIDAAYSIVLERGGREGTGDVVLSGIGWQTDSGRVAERDLVALPHLRAATRDALARAGVGDLVAEVQSWHLHDYTPDAELLAYVAIGLCEPGGALELALSGATASDGRLPVNAGGGSVRGEAPFGGPLHKVLEAIRQVRGSARAQLDGVERAFAQLSTGYAGQFQTAVVIGRGA